MDIFEFKYSANCTVSFEYKNYIATTSSGDEQSIVQWEQPLLRFDLSKEILCQEDLDYLVDFHTAQNGRSGVFLFNDPTDNFASKEQDIYQNIGARGTFAFYKTYGSFGAYKVYKKYFQSVTESSELYRPIHYPVNLQLFINGTLFTNWTWDSVEKLVIPNQNISTATKEAQFNFYVPVRFEVEEIEYTQQSIDSYAVPRLSLKETREEHQNDINNTIATSILVTFAIDGILDSTITQYRDSLREDSASGYENITETSQAFSKIQLGDRTLGQTEVDYLIGLTRITFGNAIPFNYVNPITDTISLFRFNEPISLQVLGDNDCGIIAKLANASTLVEVSPSDYAVSINTFTVTKETIRKYDLYYGFTSANGAEHSQTVVYNASLNGQQFIGGGNVPKTVNGYASLPSINSAVTIVFDQEETVGSCFVTAPLDEISFDINNWSVYFNADVGNDGMAFVLHGQTTGANSIGVMASSLGNAISFLTTPQILALTGIEGKALGYVGIAPSIIIELDAYENEFDPNDNHIGININGSLSSFATGVPGFSIQDSNVHCWIDYTGGVLSVFANTSASKPGSPVVSTAIDLNDYLGVYEQSVITTASVPIDKTILKLSYCYCWKITLKDGRVVLLTNHDSNLLIESNTYLAKCGFNNTAIDTDYEFSVDNSEGDSFFVNDIISASDVLGGKLDNAQVELYLVNWRVKTIVATLQKGIIGEVKSTSTGYSLEIRSLLEKLQTKRVKKTSSNCPLVFGETGDNKCNKSLAGLSNDTNISSVDSNIAFNVSVSQIDGYYNFGSVLFLSGANSGLTFDIFSYISNKVTLWQAVPYTIAIGDSIRITKGCEKSVTACAAYSNIANFGGDPFVPGADTYITGALEYSNPID